MTMTRLMIATLCLALAACAGSIDEPGEGQGDDNNAGDNSDNTDNGDNGDNNDEGGTPDAGDD